eukprot:3898100-Prorocentrum_lima.AAC.1
MQGERGSNLWNCGSQGGIEQWGQGVSRTVLVRAISKDGCNSSEGGVSLEQCGHLSGSPATSF